MMSRKNAREAFSDSSVSRALPGVGATARASAGIIKNTSDSGKIKHALMIYLISMKCAALVPRDRGRRCPASRTGTDQVDDITAP